MITEINTDSYNEERCYLDMTTYDEHGEFKNQVKYDFAKL